MNRKDLEVFLGKTVGILYLDSNEEVYVRGRVKTVDGSNLILETKSNKPLFLSLKNVIKIKVVSSGGGNG